VRGPLLTRGLDIGARAGVDLAYLAIGLLTATVAFGVVIAGLTVTLVSAVFIIGLPVVLLTAIVFRGVAELDRRNAALVLGEPLRGRYRDHGGERFLARIGATLTDPQTWKDLLWLILHSMIGFVFGVVALGLVVQTVGMALMPTYYWAIAGGTDVGVLNVDTLPDALLVVLAAIPLAAITVGLLRLMARGEVRLATLLLGPGSGEALAAGPQVGASPKRRRQPPEPGAVLAVHEAITALLAGVVFIIWAATGQGYFWPAWVWLGVGIPLGLHLSIREARQQPAGTRRNLAVQGAISAVIAATLIIVWFLAGGGTFWPIWSLLALLVALAVHGLIAAMWGRLFPGKREQELTERVDELTRTRRGALNVQAAELQRIERDLHDGAQARLVSLSMQLGRAEQGLADRPEMAALVRQARGEAGEAIAELRDLARGIAPPVLADRGLEAAVEALGRRAVIPVTVDMKMDRRPVPVVETAAYFVVAESLTNVAKHAPDAEAMVTISLDDRRLVAEIADNGPGGADPDGGGLSGLRSRVEALDGTLAVISPAGEGTTIRAELPCAS
jgi:signal transduction histidine kinase